MTNQLHKLLLLIVAIIFTGSAYAYDVKIDGIYYDLDTENLTASVTGEYMSYSGDVTIPASITHNGKAYSVTSIGEYAFQVCTGLTSVKISEGVTSIEDMAFYYCSRLTSVDIPSSVTSIKAGAFQYCSALTSIKIPEGVTSIEEYTFQKCSKLTSVDIPSSVTSIGDWAFLGCSGLTSIEIPEGVTEIGSRVFGICTGLTSIDIPSSVTSIGQYVFYGCSGLTAINISSDNSAYCSIDGIVYDKEKTTFILCPEAKTGSVSIPEGVTSIGESAFYNCSGLTSISIPSSVTYIGFYASEGCSGLTSIYSFNPVPPTASSYSFYHDNFENATLYVPQEAIEAYRAADGWSSFQNIQGFDPSGIKGVEAESGNRPAAYYDTNGRKSATPHHGVNIVRQSDGTTRKVMIK